MLVIQFAMQLPMLASAQTFLMGIGMLVLQPVMDTAMPIFEPIMFTGMAIILVVAHCRAPALDPEQIPPRSHAIAYSFQVVVRPESKR